MAQVRRVIPLAWKRTVKRVLLRYRYYCPVCENPVSGFMPAIPSGRPNATCPSCGARERHRLAWLFLKRRTDLFDGQPKRVLHVAAQRTIARRLQAEPALAYLTADLHDPAAMLQMDVTAIQFETATFDVILCSHVLEHVPDDRRAMRELFRVLKPAGWAILLVPITVDETFEDPSITDPRLRERLFGQADHVRQYGSDFRERLEEAGFQVQVFRPADVMTAAEMERLGVPADEYPLFYCEK